MKGGQVLGVWGQVDTGRRTSSDSKAKTPHLSVVLPRSPPQPFHLPPQTLHMPPSPPPPRICGFFSSFSPGGMRGWRTKQTQMSPADGWWWPEPRSPLGSTKPRAGPLPPRSVVLGTWWERAAFLAPPGAWSRTVSVASDTVPCRTEWGAGHTWRGLGGASMVCQHV